MRVACPFCDLDEEVVLENDLAFAVRDINPVTRGHMLVIPKRHVTDFFELSGDEVRGIYSLLVEAKQLIDREYAPAGFNVGVNNGRAAGQGIFHVHVHLIPRYAGDSWKREGVRKPTGIEKP
ncbi:MAG: HIT family protein [Candidatus Diapherotrites archaeon]|nr:HIT family protein [Candidatus Diapherotrites archaeon]